MKKFCLKQQKMYCLQVPHRNTIKSAIYWWLKNKNKYCHSFCPTCEYYFRCQEDVALIEEMGYK